MEPVKSTLISDYIEEGFRKQPPKRWPTYDGKELDRTKFVTSSEIGGCARKAKFGKTHPEEDKRSSYGAAERGHTAEAWIVEQLRLSGATVMLVGDDQVSFYFGDQSGTPDGIIVTPAGYYVLEIKSIDPRTNIYNLPRKYHLDQIQQNMDLVAVCKEEWNILGSHVVYIDAADYERKFEWKIAPNAGRQEYLERRASSIMLAKSPLDIAPEGVYSGDCKWCSFKHLCNGALEQRENEKKDNERLQDVASKFFG